MNTAGGLPPNTTAGARFCNRTCHLTLTAILGCLALLYCSYSSYELLVDEDAACDLKQRWGEIDCVASGIDPYQLFERENGGDLAVRRIQTTPWVHPGGYPPWAFFTGFVFTPPLPLALVRPYFLLVNLACLTIIARWAWGYGNRDHGDGGPLLATATLAVFANGVTLRLGQYGIIMTALLTLLLMAENAGRRAWIKQGVLLGIAALKPNITALFGFPFLVRRRFGTVALCGCYIMLACGVVWWLTGSTPTSMLRSMYAQSAMYDGDSAGGVHGSLVGLGVPRLAVTAGGVLAGIATGFMVSSCLSRIPLEVSFALLSVIGRLWMYHRRYDNVMLVFLLVVLGDLALRRPTLVRQISFLLIGASLWLPSRENALSASVVLAQSALWIWGAYLVFAYYRGTGTPPVGSVGDP